MKKHKQKEVSAGTETPSKSPTLNTTGEQLLFPFSHGMEQSATPSWEISVHPGSKMLLVKANSIHNQNASLPLKTEKRHVDFHLLMKRAFVVQQGF
jgi:hypothetical protein